MDPTLEQALRTIQLANRKAHETGADPFTDEELEAFLREETKGKYGLDDAAKVLDTNVNAWNLGRSAIQGASFGFADELAGISNALGPSVAAGIGRAIVRPGEAKRRYTEARDAVRLRDEAFKSEHPYTADAAELVGGLATAFVPLGAAKAGVTGVRALGPAATTALPWTGRLARGAKLGGGFGGVAGAGHAESLRDLPAEIGKGAAGGVVAGGALDVGVPFLGRFLGRVAPFIPARANASERLARAVAESGEPVEVSLAQQAKRAVTQMPDETGTRAVQGRLDDVVSARRGEGVTLGDLSQPLQRESDFVATNSRLGRAKLAKIADERTAGAAKRAEADIASAVHGGPSTSLPLPRASARRKALEAGRKAVGQGYDELRAQYPTMPDAKPFVLRWLNDPQVAQAWKKAAKDGAVGPRPDNAPVSFAKAHEVQHHLRELAKKAFREGNSSLGSRIKAAQQELVDDITKQIPKYGEVSRAYSHRHALVDALNEGESLGRKLFTKDGPVAGDVQQVAEAMRSGPGNRWAPKELTTNPLDSEGAARRLDQFRYGILSELVRGAGNTPSNRSFAAKVANASPNTRAILKLAFGDQGTFERYMLDNGIEKKMASALSRALEGSSTALREGERGLGSFGRGALWQDVVRSLSGNYSSPQQVADAMQRRMTRTGQAEVSNLIRELGRRTPPSSVSGTLTGIGAAPQLAGPVYEAERQVVRPLWEMLGQGAQ